MLSSVLLVFCRSKWVMLSCKWGCNRRNGVRHINEVKLRRARLVLGWWRPLSGLPSGPLRPTQPGHPSVRRWLRPSLGRHGASEVTTFWRFV